VEVAVDAAANVAEAVAQEDRTTLAPGRWLRVVFALHLVFDYGHRAAADQMRTSWEKLVQFMGTNYGQDISNELQNKIPVILSELVHTPEVLARHAIHEQMVRTGEENLQRARLLKCVILEAAATLGADPDAPMQLAILDNEIAEGNYKQNNEVPIEISDSEKMQYSNDWRTYQERNVLLTKHRGQAFSLILGQCTQLLQDRMKQDTDWNMMVAQLMQTAGLRRSMRVKIQPKLYKPTMTGSKYSYAVTQLEIHGVLYPDSHMFIQEDFYQSDPDVVAHIMTQLSLKSGLKQWGDKAYAAVTSEMKQLHFRNTFKPKHWSELSKTQRQTVLESHMFLKEKRDGSLKGRTVAGGNKQRDYISKEDASSPTVATEAVLLSCIIDAEEGRDVAVIDIPNAFIQTRVEDEGDMAIIKIRGVLVDILVKIAPDVYKSYITTDKKGTKQLLVQCQNALYGTMVASLLYYRKFTEILTSVGFKINPYDPCVANKIVDGMQMTICFHVDDCKLSHHSSRANDNIIDWLR
jgi:hypothetical protein